MLRLTSAKPLRRGQKVLAVLVIAIATVALAYAITSVPPLAGAAKATDTALYDAFYRRCTPESQLDGPLVIIAVDQSSIDRMSAEENQYRWPWPRVYWGAVLEYLQKCGAKAVAVDLLFEEPSGYNRETNDDTEFARVLDRLTIPIIHAGRQSAATTHPRFAPPVTKPAQFGAVDVIDDVMVRTYASHGADRPSLAVETVRAAGRSIPAWANETFLIHYYGPSRRADGTDTFRYRPAFDVVRAAISPDGTYGTIKPADFRDRIVLIGATAAAAFDLKSSPLSGIFPSVEAQATAMSNLIENRRVTVSSMLMQLAIAFLGALLAAAGATFPRNVVGKLLLSLIGIAVAFLIAFQMFTASPRITWLPLSMPMLAAIFATISGLAWTYLAEDRQRRALLRALSQYVSPEVAAELNRRGEISLVGQRREMTVMFTDLAGFTTLADHIPVEKLERFMNGYFSQMSSVLFDHNATVDKFIGDAIMSFWNAPLGQPEHAELACRAALAMLRRERAEREFFAQYVSTTLRTRIGINTGTMVVGNVGSEQKINYTVLGDGVNLASRLEQANKIYGSQILLSQSTVAKLKPGTFLLRKLDHLRVAGRSTAEDVFELMDETSGDSRFPKLAADFENALAHYFAREWDAAKQILIDLSAQFPDDGPTAVLLKRVRSFRDNPPPPDWDGVYDASH